MRSKLGLSLLLVFALGAGAPEALEKARAQRDLSKLQTARVEFSITDQYAEMKTPVTRYFSYEFALDRWKCTICGDSEGVIYKSMDERPLPPVLNKPIEVLVEPEHHWRHQEDALFAERLPPNIGHLIGVTDLRQLGLSPVGFDADPEDLARSSGSAIRYTQERDGDLWLVTGGTDADAGKVRWWIDPSKRWFVVRNAVFHGDEQLCEQRFYPKYFPDADIWFPVRAERFHFRESRDRPVVVLQVHAAEFNRAEHPQELTLASIGIESGLRINLIDAWDQPAAGTGFWNGREIISQQEFFEGLKNGTLEYGPNVARLRARAREWTRENYAAPAEFTNASPTLPAASQPDGIVRTLALALTTWEAYTRDFIHRLRLDDEQQQRAWVICHEAQAAGRALVERALRERLAGVAKAGDARGADDPPSGLQVHVLDPGALLNADLPADVAGRLQKIFDAQLKARLERLPTRAQERQAQSVEAP